MLLLLLLLLLVLVGENDAFVSLKIGNKRNSRLVVSEEFTTAEGEAKKEMEKARKDLEQDFRRATQDPSFNLQGDRVSPKDYHVPAEGISVNEVMVDSKAERFRTTFMGVPGLPSMDDDDEIPVGPRMATIVTNSDYVNHVEPLRYMISLNENEFVLVDTPPFSDALASEMLRFMKGDPKKLVAMVITSENGIHYDEASYVYSVLRSDMKQWTQAFPETKIICHRMDAPRDCREMITQVLQGNGPWAWDHENKTFVETGRPLVREPWTAESFKRFLKAIEEPQKDNDHLYTPEAIKKREEGKEMLAVYTPGHSFGSISYVFPKLGLLASGLTIPIETTSDENIASYASDIGPSMDCRGYISTSADMVQQMKSASELIKTYVDRFHTVLSSKADPLILYHTETRVRRYMLLNLVEQYEKLGKIYQQLGITDKELNVEGDEEENDDHGSLAP